MAQNAHIEFLQLLGWEGAELEAFLPDWLHAAEFLKLSEQDVEVAIHEWLPRYWDLSLRSVRKLIAACIREVVAFSKTELYKKEGKKVLYSNPTAAYVSIYANKLAGGDQLHVAYPGFIIMTVLQSFFGKKETPADGKTCMSTSCQHCALNGIRVNYCTEGRIPMPTVTWTWGLHCNESHKIEELVDCLDEKEWRNVLTTIPHDAPLGTIEAEDDDRVAYLAEQIREGQRQVSEITGIEVTEAHLQKAMDVYLTYMGKIERLTDLVVNADPQPISGNALTQFSLCMEVCFDTGMDYINDALDTAIEEVEERIRKGTGVLPKGAPKLACHFLPTSMPWIGKSFLENGVNLSLGRIFPPASWLKKALDEKDLYQSVACHCLMSPNAVNMQNEAAITMRILQQYTFDGALYGFYSHDRWMGALHKAMIREVEEHTGIPHYYLESAFWDSEHYSVEDRLPIIRSICNSLKISSI